MLATEAEILKLARVALNLALAAAARVPMLAAEGAAHLLAAGLADLLHLLVFALHLLGVALPLSLHLHLQTQLGLAGQTLLTGDAPALAAQR